MSLRNDKLSWNHHKEVAFLKKTSRPDAGKRHYGDGLYKEAEGVLGIPKGTLQNLKSISDQFEISRRREILSWGHHYEVASLKKTSRPDVGK